MVKEEIKRLVEAKGARVGVIGLGYVGLPLAVEFARKGLRAVGFEVDERKAEQINRGESYIGDVPSEALAEVVSAERLHATTDFNELSGCDVIIICVPTPLRKTKEPDISYILAAAGEIQKHLRRGQLVVLESTTYPGTTDEVLLPMFEELGLKLDEDFLLAFSPERVDPGNPQFHTDNIPKVVGGCTDDSTEVAAALYRLIVKDVHAVSSARVAEAAKLLENTFRAVNIGMANEMARLCYALGIDTWEVIRAAATKPFGFMAFYPGPGIGGHCIPLRPALPVVEGAAARVRLALHRAGRGGQLADAGARGDARHRRAQRRAEVFEGLARAHPRRGLQEGHRRRAGKPCALDHRPSAREGGGGASTTTLTCGRCASTTRTRRGAASLWGRVELTDEELEAADCAVIVTDHSGVDYARVCRLSKVIVDTRNALSRDQRRDSCAKIVRL